MRAQALMPWDSLTDRVPAHALVEGVDLVIIRHDDSVTALYGRCPHRGALLSDGHVEGCNLICGVHFWDFRFESGVSEYDNDDRLARFPAWVEEGTVVVDMDSVAQWAADHPQPYRRNRYLGAYTDPHGAPEEPDLGRVRDYAENGLGAGGHGALDAMGVPRDRLPAFDDIQFVTAQFHRLPLADDAPVDTETVIGPRAARPLRLDGPVLVSDMSFGALSEPAKLALARGAEWAGTGICSGEGGMLPEEQQANSRYLYELASGRFGFTMDRVARCQAFHFKLGQAAKTGVGGHLPGRKVTDRIAEVRGLTPGEDAVSPSRFPDLTTPADFATLAGEVRAATGGIPVGFKMSAQNIERDLDAALEAGADYVILDGRGGGTGAAPTVLRDHIAVPLIPAIARARRHLDRRGARAVSLIATGGLRTPADFAKALALGADAVAIANSALHAIGCQAMRACHTNNCPVGIATQKAHLTARLDPEQSARRLARFLDSATELMRLLARACGRESLAGLCPEDLVAWKEDTARLAGIPFAGPGGGT